MAICNLYKSTVVKTGFCIEQGVGGPFCAILIAGCILWIIQQHQRVHIYEIEIYDYRSIHHHKTGVHQIIVKYQRQSRYASSVYEIQHTHAKTQRKPTETRSGLTKKFPLRSILLRGADKLFDLSFQSAFKAIQ